MGSSTFLVGWVCKAQHAGSKMTLRNQDWIAGSDVCGADFLGHAPLLPLSTRGGSCGQQAQQFLSDAFEPEWPCLRLQRAQHRLAFQAKVSFLSTTIQKDASDGQGFACLHGCDAL